MNEDKDRGEDLLGAHNRALVLTATAAALVGSTRVGLLDAILAKPLGIPELARELGLHEDATARVIGLLDATGLTRRDVEGAVVPAPILDAEAKGPGGGPAKSLKIWSGIEDYLRTGRSYLDSVPGEQPRGPAYARAVTGLGRIFRALSQDLAAELSQVGGAGRILDVGAGSGQWTLAMLGVDDAAKVTGLDLAPVLPRFMENARALGLEGRVETLAGDYHEVALEPQAYDRIVAANVLHLESEPDAASLVARLTLALAPGGQLVIVDALPPTGSKDDPAFAAYALSLGLRTGRGRPHAERDLRSWLHAAGLGSVERVEIGKSGSMVAALCASRDA